MKIIIKISCFILLILFSQNCNSQDSKKIDSLLQVINTTDNDSVKMKSYSKLRRATIFSNPKIAQNYTFKYLEYAEKIKDSQHIGFANFYLANAFIAQSDYENALTRLFKSVTYFQKKKDSSRMCSMYNSIGAVYENTDNDSLALIYFKKAYDIGNARGDIRRSALAASNVALIYNNNKQYEIGIPYLEKAFKNLKDSEYIEYYTSIAINLANAYRDTNRFSEAQPIYNDVLTKIDTIKDVFNHGVVLRGLAALNIEFKNNKTALQQLKKVNELYSTSDYFYERYSALPDLISAFYVNGEHQKGLEYFYEYNTIKDSIFNSEKDKILVEALQKYETEKKDAELKLLKREQELNRAKQKAKNMLYYVVIFAFSLLLFFLWFRNKKRKAFYKQELEIKEQENVITQLKLENEKTKTQKYENELKQYMQLMITKNSQIQNLKQELEHISLTDEDRKELGEKLNSLYRATVLTNDDWNDFRAMFDQVHPEFILEITKHIPKISPGDLKMATMLKLNLSNPEVASILGISDESVRKSKYRLRKKLGINSNSELIEFILNT